MTLFAYAASSGCSLSARRRSWVARTASARRWQSFQSPVTGTLTATSSGSSSGNSWVDLGVFSYSWFVTTNSTDTLLAYP